MNIYVVAIVAIVAVAIVAVVDLYVEALMIRS